MPRPASGHALLNRKIKMKSSTLLSWAAIIASAFAISLTMTAPRQPTEAQIDARVDARLVERERQLVDRFAPKFKVMFAEMGDSPEGKDDWSPKTLEELFAPLVKIISTMGEQE